jgi:hypothetical protein
MKTSEFKKILKPLIMQSVKEVLLQEGILSNIVAEVVRGLGRPINENNQQAAALRSKEEKKLEKQRQERIKKLNESNKFGDVFSGTREVVEESPQGPLTGVPSADRGVDIEAIEKLSSGKWKTLMG